MRETEIASDGPVSDNVLIDVSGWRLDRFLTDVVKGEETNAMRTALDRIIATPSNCANSFQSSI
ncbi:MAG: hypothetical protein ABSA93_32885 [Streptosporangiaceae bacterium]|jgi:hypothetical protein